MSDGDYESYFDDYEQLANRYVAKKKGTKKMITKDMLEKNKYYVGSNSIFERNWGHRNLEDAQEHAAEIAETQESDVFIVQIIGVVRRPKVPVVYEEVK